MYKSGFTVNEGEYRELTDEANRPFLMALSKGMIPQELVPAGQAAGEIDVHLVDKRKEEYEKPDYTAFSGSGNSMAEEKVVEASDTIIPVMEASTQESKEMVVDTTAKTSQIQLKLNAGGRIIVKCNPETHTLTNLIEHLRFTGSEGNARYQLMGGYPPKVIVGSEFGKSLAELGVAGGIVQQKGV